MLENKKQKVCKFTSYTADIRFLKYVMRLRFSCSVSCDCAILLLDFQYEQFQQQFIII